MAKLDDLRKRIYKPGETFTDRMHEPELAPPPRETQQGWWRSKAPMGPSQFRKWMPWIISGGVAVALGVVLIWVLIAPSSFFDTTAVEMVIVGQQEVQSGDRIVWTVEAVNKNTVALESAAIIFNYPEGARTLQGTEAQVVARERRELGAVFPGEYARATFDAYVFGGQRQEKKVSALIEFRPAGASATFAKTAEFSFTIVRSPVSVSIDIPSDVRSGQQLSIVVHYASQADYMVSDVGVALMLPSEFVFDRADPRELKKELQPEGTMIVWRLGDIRSAESGSLRVEGEMGGKELDPKSFRAVIGVMDPKNNTVAQTYDDVTVATTLRPPFLEVRIESSSVVQPDGEATVRVFWRNNLPVEVRNPILEVVGKGDALNPLSLQPSAGSFRENAMIWQASSYSPFQLIPPGGSGVVDFKFKTKSNLARGPKDPRPTAMFVATFRPTADIAGFEGVEVSGSDSFEVKVTTRFTFATRGVHFQSAIPNSGPLPPQVGKETTYTVAWSFTNMSNDVDGVVVRSSLPPYMKFKNIINPEGADITFEESSGFITWNVGRVFAGTGFVRPALQAAFQVGIVPIPIQAGTEPALLRQSTASGRDTFTNQEFRLTSPDITTTLRDDPAVTSQQRKVIPAL